jgi:hypothetical protein
MGRWFRLRKLLITWIRFSKKLRTRN